MHLLPGKVERIKPAISLFAMKNVRGAIYKNTSTVKGSSVVIKKDLSREALSLFQKVCSRFGKKIVWTSFGKSNCELDKKVIEIRNFQYISLQFINFIHM